MQPVVDHESEEGDRRLAVRAQREGEEEHRLPAGDCLQPRPDQPQGHGDHHHPERRRCQAGHDVLHAERLG